MSAVKPLVLAVAATLAIGPLKLHAGPAGEQVVAGQASVTRSGANTLITQTTDRVAINWQSFNIGAAESVRFAQPAASSIALNRILGQDPSTILGNLTANGQVFILNPNGVLFGRGAQVNVGGLVASTLGMSNESFMAGRYSLFKPGNAGSVVNAGEIIANGGYVALIGPRVGNEGRIAATSGSVTLAAGDKVTLSLDGNKLIGLTVDQGALNALAENKGLIKADGGVVLLTAKAADTLVRSVVNNEGILEATTLSSANGVIRLEGDTIINSGIMRADGGAHAGGVITLSAGGDITLNERSVVSANGAGGGQITAQAQNGVLWVEGSVSAAGVSGQGGAIALLGERVGLLGAANVNASGNAGGGSVLVGGNFQGAGPEQNAAMTYVGSNAQISANAIASGNGGRVIVWANDRTRYFGNISATGGAQRGNGGFVEVSGHRGLTFEGSVNTSAPNGKTGTLLLDPTNLYLINGNIFVGDQDEVIVGAKQLLFADANKASNTVSVGALQAVGNNNILLQATNEIVVGTQAGAAATVSLPDLTSSTLTLSAGNNTGGLGNVRFNSGSSITTGGGGLTINAGVGQATGSATLGAISTGAGNLTVTAAQGVTASGSITANAVSITAGGTLNTTGVIAASGDVSLTATGVNSDINVLNNITVSNAAAKTLTLRADRDVVIGNGTTALNISAGGAGALTVDLNADRDANQQGMVFFNSNSKTGNVAINVTTNGGDLKAHGGVTDTTRAFGWNETGGTTNPENNRRNGVAIATGTTLTTGAGNVTAYGQGMGTVAGAQQSHNGIGLSGSIVTNGGNVTLDGIGGKQDNGNVVAAGVNITNGSINTSAGAGKITLTGVGGTMSGTNTAPANGVSIQDSNGAGLGSTVRAGAGGILITGTGGNTTAAGATGSGVRGVFIGGGTQATGSLVETINGGAITINGTGGTTASTNGAAGVQVGSGSNTVLPITIGMIKTDTGTITATGVGGTTGTSAAIGTGAGISVNNGSGIGATGAGTVNITGTGGTGSTTKYVGIFTSSDQSAPAQPFNDIGGANVTAVTLTSLAGSGMALQQTNVDANPANGVITLNATGGGNIAGASAKFTANGLRVINDTVATVATLTNPNNDVATIAANLPGGGASNLTYVDASGLTVGTVGATSGITANAVSITAGGTLNTTGVIAASGDVSLTATGVNSDINVLNNITVSNAAAKTLTLRADRDVVIGNGTTALNISAGGAGALTVDLNADRDANQQGMVFFNSNSKTGNVAINVTTNGGDLKAHGGVTDTTRAFGWNETGGTTNPENNRRNGVAIATGTTLTTGAGNVTAYGQGMGTVAGAQQSHNGIGLSGSIVTNGGNVTLDGIGGKQDNGNVVAAGVNITNGSINTSAGAGKITLTGVGGTMSGTNTAPANGVSIQDSNGAGLGSTVRAGAGGILITGTGGNTTAAGATGSGVRGVFIGGGTQATGSLVETINGGAITINGTGGTTASTNGAAGVQVGSGSNTVLPITIGMIKTDTGTITATGVGGTTGTSAAIGTGAGISVNNGSGIGATGAGTVNITGTGGTGSTTKYVGIFTSSDQSAPAQPFNDIGGANVTAVTLTSLAGSGMALQQTNVDANPANGVITLNATGGGNIAGASAKFTANGLRVINDTVATVATLTNPNNDVATIAANLPGGGASNLTYVDASGLTVGTVGATSGITANAVSITAGGTLNTTGVIAASGDVSLTATGVNSDINVLNNITVSNAAAKTLTLRADRDVVIGNGTTALNISAGGAGALTVDLNADRDANQQGMVFFNSNSKTGNVAINVTTNGGDLKAHGGVTDTTRAFGWNETGGTTNPENNRRNGVAIATGTTLTTGAGNVTAYGQGMGTVAGAQQSHNGIGLSGSIVTNGGNVTLDGIGGKQDNGNVVAAGVNITNGSINTSAGAGKITLTGVGGTMSGTNTAPANGVSIQDSNGAGLGSTVRAGAGGILITGTGGNTTAAGATGSGVRGVFIGGGTQATGSLVETINGGAITINGTGGTTASTNGAAGVQVGSGSNTVLPITIGMIKTDTGTITATGVGGTTGTSAAIGTGAGISVNNGSGIGATGAGTVNITGTGGTGSTTKYVGIFTSSDQSAPAQPFNDIGGANVTAVTLTSLAGSGMALQQTNVDANPANGVITLNATGGGNIAGASAKFTANGLRVINDTVATVATLTNPNNDVATIAANTGTLTYVDANALSIGTVNATAGVTAAGLVSISTQTGDLTLNNNIVTASTSANAVTLVADVASSPNAGGTGGNFKNPGSSAITTGAGGAWRIYSGNPAGTTRGGLVEAGKRYNVDDAADPIGAGKRIYFRVQPTLTLTADDKAMIYGGANPLFTVTPTGLIDGDTLATAVTSGPTYTVGGTVSTSGNLTAGTPHAITPAAATPSALGYGINHVAGNLTVNALALTAAIANVTTPYGTAAATGAVSLTNKVGADAVSTAAATLVSPAFSASGNLNAGSYKQTVGATLIGADAGNYTLAGGFTTATNNYLVNPITLAVNYTGINRVYDGTTGATVTTTDNRLAGDVLTINRAAAFTNKDVGSGKTVNVSGVSLGGTDAANYTVAATGATTANITPLAITGSITAGNKVYDAGVGATITGRALSGVLGADSVSYTGGTATFSDKNVGNAKIVSATGLGLSGAQAGNYSVNATATTTANITPATLTVTYTGVNRVYDATATATVTTTDNRLGADVLTINRTATFADANAGNGKTVNVTGVSLSGGDAVNYTVAATGSTTANITARGISVAANNASKVYGGTDPAFTFTVGGAGLAGADTITSVMTGALARAPGENVAGSPYAINQGTLATNANYTITGYAPGQFSITPKALTITADNKSKVSGEALPPFTATYNGFGFTDTAASLTGVLLFATPATATSPAGEYVITPSGQTSQNYAITYINGNLTVKPGLNNTDSILASLYSPPENQSPQTTPVITIQESSQTQGPSSLIEIVNGGVNLPTGVK